MQANGHTGDVAGVYDIGDLRPRTKPLRGIRGDVNNPAEEVLRGYRSGKGCPINIRISVRHAILDFKETMADIDQRIQAEGEGLTALTIERMQAQREEAMYAHYRDVLLAVVIGLEFNEAEVLAGDERAEEILQELGWLPKPDAEEDSDEDVDPQTERTIPSTGESSSPTLAPSTTSAPASSST